MEKRERERMDFKKFQKESQRVLSQRTKGIVQGLHNGWHRITSAVTTFLLDASVLFYAILALLPFITGGWERQQKQRSKI